MMQSLTTLATVTPLENLAVLVVGLELFTGAAWIVAGRVGAGLPRPITSGGEEDFVDG